METSAVWSTELWRWVACSSVFVKKYTLILWFLAFLRVKELGRMFLQMSVCLFQIISRLDCQSKFQIFTLFPAAMLVHNRGAPTWRLHAGLCKFAQNISMNIRSLDRQRELKLKEECFLPLFYNIASSLFWVTKIHICTFSSLFSSRLILK